MVHNERYSCGFERKRLNRPLTPLSHTQHPEVRTGAHLISGLTPARGGAACARAAAAACGMLVEESGECQRLTRRRMQGWPDREYSSRHLCSFGALARAGGAPRAQRPTPAPRAPWRVARGTPVAAVGGRWPHTRHGTHRTSHTWHVELLVNVMVWFLRYSVGLQAKKTSRSVRNPTIVLLTVRIHASRQCQLSSL